MSDLENFKQEKFEKDKFIRELFKLAFDEYERRQKEEYAHPDDSFMSAFAVLEVYLDNRI
jgi:hypothetical protein